MTACHWVEMLQSEAVSFKKFVMREPERGKEEKRVIVVSI